MTDKSGDTVLQSMIAEIAPRFQLMTFEDTETGTSLQYQLYIPENYDES
jgi:predicted peptidase